MKPLTKRNNNKHMKWEKIHTKLVILTRVIVVLGFALPDSVMSETSVDADDSLLLSPATNTNYVSYGNLIAFTTSMTITILLAWVIPSTLSVILKKYIGFELEANEHNIEAIMAENARIYNEYLFGGGDHDTVIGDKMDSKSTFSNSKLSTFDINQHPQFNRHYDSPFGYIRTKLLSILYLFLTVMILIIGFTFSFRLIGIEFITIIRSIGLLAALSFLPMSNITLSFIAFIWLNATDEYKVGNLIGIDGIGVGTITEIRWLHTRVVMFHVEQFAPPYLANDPNHTININYRKVRPASAPTNVPNKIFIDTPIRMYKKN